MSDTSKENRPPKILVVDDDLHTCRLLKQILERAGYEPTVFNNPHAIDPKDIAWKYPLAILDFEMPGITGIELFERIRKYDPVIDAIILTGQGAYKDAIAGYRVGIASWVIKPWDKKLLVSEIERVLKRQQTLIERLREEFETNFKNIKIRLDIAESIANSTKDQIRALRQNPG